MGGSTMTMAGGDQTCDSDRECRSVRHELTLCKKRLGNLDKIQSIECVHKWNPVYYDNGEPFSIDRGWVNRGFGLQKIITQERQVYTCMLCRRLELGSILK